MSSAFVDVFCRYFALNKCGVVSRCVEELVRWWIVQTIGRCSHSRGRVLFSRFSADLDEKQDSQKIEIIIIVASLYYVLSTFLSLLDSLTH